MDTVKYNIKESKLLSILNIIAVFFNENPPPLNTILINQMITNLAPFIADETICDKFSDLSLEEKYDINGKNFVLTLPIIHREREHYYAISKSAILSAEKCKNITFLRERIYEEECTCFLYEHDKHAETIPEDSELGKYCLTICEFYCKLLKNHFMLPKNTHYQIQVMDMLYALLFRENAYRLILFDDDMVEDSIQTIFKGITYFYGDDIDKCIVSDTFIKIYNSLNDKPKAFIKRKVNENRKPDITRTVE